MDGGHGIDRGHQTLMDGIYRRQRLIYDATRKYFLFGRDHLIARLDPPEGGHILEMACGTGRNLFNIGKRYPGTYLYGFDISSEMLITARQSMEKRGPIRPHDACRGGCLCRGCDGHVRAGRVRPGCPSPTVSR